MYSCRLPCLFSILPLFCISSYFLGVLSLLRLFQLEGFSEHGIVCTIVFSF